MTSPKNSALHNYQEIAAQSAAMLASAQAGHWDELIEQGNTYQLLVEHLRASPQPAPEEAPACQALLTRILQDDASIRQLMLPQLSHLRKLMGSARKERVVVDSYHSTVRS